MQTVTFTCLNCNNLMAVGVEFLGQQVQCPTCGQVVLAPAAAPDPAPTPTAFAPEFKLESGKPEAVESIFSDEVHDEDLFGTPKPKVVMPLAESPTEPLSPPPSPNGPNQTGFAAYPPGVPQPGAAGLATTVLLPPPAEAPPIVSEPPAPAEQPLVAPAPPGISWSKIGAPQMSEPWHSRPTANESAPADFPDLESQSTPSIPQGEVAPPRRKPSNLLPTI